MTIAISTVIYANAINNRFMFAALPNADILWLD